MKKATMFCLVLILFITMSQSGGFSQETTEMNEGMKLFYARDTEKAKKCFRSAFEKEPNNSLPLLYLLDCYAREKNLQPILNEFEEIALEKPNSALSKAHLGLAYFAMSLFKNDMMEDALTQFKDALKIDNNLALGYLGMGIIYHRKRMIPRSRSYFSKAMKLNPNDVVALERLGEIFLLDDKNPQSARTLFEEIIKLYPTYPDGYFYFASASQDMGEYDKAIEYYEKALELDPSGMGQGYYAPQRIGDIYYRLKNYPKAIEYFERSLKINPENSYSKRMLEQSKNPPKEEPEHDKKETKKKEDKKENKEDTKE